MRLRHIKLNDFKGQVKLKDLKVLIRERDFDKIIMDKFPISNFGDLDDELMVYGSYQLLEAFKSINDEKIDILTELSGVELVGFDVENEVILSFGDIIAKGCYDFTYQFFEVLFQMGRYAKFCLRNDFSDLIRTNFDELMEKMKDEVRQYRIIAIGDEYLLRGITSDRYNNYDNHLALYLTFLALHKYTSETGIKFKVEYADITDSSITVFFQQVEPIFIDDVGQVYFGIVLSNGEIRDRRFTLELRYRILDQAKNHSSLAGIVTDSVFSINHLVKPDTIEKKILGMFKLEDLKQIMLSYISSLKSNMTLSSDVIYRLFKEITDKKSGSFSKETKAKIRDLYDRNLIDNTLTILELFDRLDSIITDIDEKTCLERIYHKMLMDLVKK